MIFIPSTFKCNGCGREHTPSNGWYELHIAEVTDEGEPSLMILSFGGNESGFVKHYCGKECLIRAISTRLYLLHAPAGSGSPSRSEFPQGEQSESIAPGEVHGHAKD